MKWMLPILLCAMLAGCLGGGDDDTETVEAERMPLPDDPMPPAPHDHTDPRQHKFLWNYDFTDRDPMLQNDVNIAGVHALDIAAGHLFGAVYGSHAVAVDGGLVIWSLSDPQHPEEVGRLPIPGAVGGDRSIEVTSDGDLAVMVMESLTCLGQVSPLSQVITAILVDTSNKAAPVLIDTLTFSGQTTGDLRNAQIGRDPTQATIPSGEHSIAVHDIDGTDYAWIFGHMYRIDRSAPAPSLVYTGFDANVGHDMYVRTTPWNHTWGLAANGFGNLQVHDFTVPDDPRVIAEWDIPHRDEMADAGITHYLHTADVTFFDDQIIIVITSEDWLDYPSPFWILDGTELMDHDRDGEPVQLETIGKWSNPGGHGSIGTSFSLHNPRFHDDGIFSLSSYHGGLWQFDFRDEAFRADPAEIAYIVYAEGNATRFPDPVFSLVEQELCGLYFTLDAPTYMDVEIGPDGILYLADVYMGLYTFTPTASHPVYGQLWEG